MLPPKEFVLAEMIISHVSQATNVQGTSLSQKLLMLGLQLPAEHSLEQSCDSIDVPCCYIERHTNLFSLVFQFRSITILGHVAFALCMVLHTHLQAACITKGMPSC